MQTLNLNIKDKCRIELNALVLLDVICKLLLLLELDVVKSLDCVCVNLALKLLKLGKISEVCVRTDFLCEKL